MARYIKTPEVLEKGKCVLISWLARTLSFLLPSVFLGDVLDSCRTPWGKLCEIVLMKKSTSAKKNTFIRSHRGQPTWEMECACVFVWVCVCLCAFFLLKCCRCDTFITGDIHELNSSCGRARGGGGGGCSSRSEVIQVCVRVLKVCEG